MNRKFACCVLLVCPLSLFALSIFTTNLQGPFYYGNNSDPEYAYLLNGLNVATLRAPGIYSHPGTTLAVTEGAIILGKWAVGSLFGPRQSLSDAVLLHPEDYLHAIGLVLNLLLSAAIYFAARRIYRLSESLLSALVFQIGFGMFMETFHSLARVSLEPLLVTAVVVLMLPVSRMVFRRDDELPETGGRLATATGAALAFGLVTKITFAPLLATCLLFRKKSALAACVASTVACTLVLLFPVWKYFPDMYIWFRSLLIHTEHYGNGPVGFPSAAMLLSNSATILRGEPMLASLAVCYAVACVAVRKGWVRTPDGAAARVGRLLLTGIVVIAVQVAITVKHFAMHYLLPAMLFTMLLNAALVFLFRRAEPGKASRGLFAAFVLVLVLGLWHGFSGLAAWMTPLNQYRADVSSILDRRREMKDCAVIPYYRSSSQEYALPFGDDWTGSLYGPELTRLYPNAIHYNIWAHRFYSMKMELRSEEIRRALAGGACYLMQGTPPSNEDLERLIGFTLTPVLVANSEGLYRLGLGASTVVIAEAALPSNAIPIDARKLSSGNVVIDDSNYGIGIGVIVSPIYPAHVEYKFPLQEAGRYQLRIRCASLDSRPVTVLINGSLATRTGCPEPTGGFDPAHQQWQVAGAYEFNGGVNTIRMESSGPFPAINRLGLVPLAR